MVLRVLFFFLSIQGSIHPKLRKQRFVQFMYNLFGYTDILFPEGGQGVAKLASDFFLFEDRNLRYLRYNGQSIVLEYVLNNVIVSDYRESLITIEDSVRSELLYYHNTGEPFDNVYMSNVGEQQYEPVYIGNYNEYLAETDFIVRVNQEVVTDDHKAYLRSIVDKFKVAGKNYEVLSLNE